MNNKRNRKLSANKQKRQKDKSFLLVDGYNIIYAWDFLKEIALDSLENARDALIDVLCDYNGYIENTLILVFDANSVKGGKGAVCTYKNIHIVYTKESETADNYIEKTVREVSKNYNVSVATSDYLEQIIILSSGAIRISAQELFEDIKSYKEKARTEYFGRKTGKDNLLFDNLDPEIADYLEKLRRM